MKRFIWKNTEYNGMITALLLALSVFAGEIITILYYSLQTSFLALFCDLAAMLAIFLLLNLIPDGWIKKITVLVFFLFFYGCTLIETVYVGFYNNFSPIRSLLYAGKYVKGELGMRLNPAAYINIAIGAAVLVFAALIPLKRAEKSFRKRRFVRRLAGCLAAFCCAAAVYGGVYSDSRRTFADTGAFLDSGTFAFSTMYNSKAYVGQYGYWSYRLRELTFKPEIAGKAEIDAYFAASAREKAVNAMTLNRGGSGAADGYYHGYNIVNILSESLDTRIIDKDITPNLYGLVYGGGTGREADIYQDYYVPVFFDGSTINSEFMSMNGIYPVSATMWSTNMGDMYSGNKYDKYSLPAQLGRAGYDTYYFHNEIKKNYERSEFMPGFGFQNLYFYDEMSMRYENDPSFKWPLDSALAGFIEEYAFTGENAGRYRSGEKNFYINVMTYSMHAGRKDIFEDYAAAVREKYRDKELPEVVIYYLARAMEYDKLVGDMIALLERQGVLHNTLLNIYPDHYVYTINELYTDFLKIPYKDYTVHKQTLIMLDGAKYGAGAGNEYGAGQGPAGTSYAAGCTLDLAPTFLNMLLGTDAEYGYFFGNDMMDGSYAVFPDLSVCDGGGYLKLGGEVTGNGDTGRLRQLQADAYEKFKISQGIHEINYFNK